MRVSNWASAKLLALPRPNSNPDPSRNLSLNLRCKSRTWAVEAIGAELAQPRPAHFLAVVDRKYLTCPVSSLWILHRKLPSPIDKASRHWHSAGATAQPVISNKDPVKGCWSIFAACWCFPGCRRPTGRKYAKRSKYLDCLKLLFNFLRYSSPQKTRCVGLSLFMAFAQCHL